MIRPSKDLLDLAIVATDGEIGDVKDLYFDDESWAIRYLVVETGSWLSSRKVLVSPIAAGKPDWVHKLLPVSLTRQQVKVDLTRDALQHAPSYDPALPLARDMEIAVFSHYGRTGYWTGAPALTA